MAGLTYNPASAFADLGYQSVTPYDQYTADMAQFDTMVAPPPATLPEPPVANAGSAAGAAANAAAAAPMVLPEVLGPQLSVTTTPQPVQPLAPLETYAPPPQPLTITGETYGSYRVPGSEQATLDASQQASFEAYLTAMAKTEMRDRAASEWGLGSADLSRAYDYEAYNALQRGYGGEEATPASVAKNAFENWMAQKELRDLQEAAPQWAAQEIEDVLSGRTQEPGLVGKFVSGLTGSRYGRAVSKVVGADFIPEPLIQSGVAANPIARTLGLDKYLRERATDGRVSLADVYQTADRPSDIAKQQTIKLLGDNAAGRIVGETLNQLLAPENVIGAGFTGKGLLANLLGRGDITMVQYGSMIAGGTAAASAAAEAGLPPWLQMAVALPGGIAALSAVDLAEVAARGSGRALARYGETALKSGVGAIPEGAVRPAELPVPNMRLPRDVQTGEVAPFAAVGGSDFTPGRTFNQPNRPRMYGGQSQADIAAINAKLGSGEAMKRNPKALREVMPLNADMEELGQGLVFDRAALGLETPAAINARLDELYANPKGKFSEIGKLEAQLEVHAELDQWPDAAQQFDRVGDKAIYQSGFGVANKAKAAEFVRVHEAMANDTFDNFNFDTLIDPATGVRPERMPIRVTPNPRITPRQPAAPLAPATVKRADLFGNVTDTYATEAELNGIRQSQGQLNIPATPKPPEPVSASPASGAAAAPAQVPPAGRGGGGAPPAAPRPVQPPASMGGELPSGIQEAKDIANAKIPSVFNVESGVQPGIARQVAGQAVPGYKAPRQVLVANSARESVQAQVTSFTDPLLKAADIEDVWKASPARYIGASDDPNIGTWYHYLENWWDYEGVSPALISARQQWDEAFNAGLRRMEDVYGVTINPYLRRGPNGEVASYVPHMESTDVLDARRKAGELGPERETLGTSKVAIEKERGIPTIGERMKFDPDFKPETDARTIAQRYGAMQTDAASRATYKALINGKTEMQLLEEGHPELLALRKKLTGDVTATKGRIAREQANYLAGRKATELTEQAAERLQGKIDLVSARIAELGDDFGPELSYLSGEARQMTRQLSEVGAANARALAQAESGIVNLTANLTKYIDEAEKLADVRRTVRTTNRRVVNGKVYAFDPVTNKWVTPDVARASAAISRTKTNGIIALLEEARSVQLNGGDLSPVTYGHSQMGAAGYLGTTAHMVTHPREVAKAIATNDVWKGVDQEMLGVYQGLRGRSVRSPLAEIRPDDAKRGLERLPKVGKGIRAVNDLANRIATYGDYLAWETSVRSIMRKPEFAHLTLAQAGAESMKAMDNIAAKVDLSKLGLSRAAQRVINAPLTSLSYMGATPQFAVSYSRAGGKLMGEIAKNKGNPLNAWRALGAADQETLIHGTELLASVTALSAASNVLFGDETKSIERRLKESANPLSGDWWMLKLPGGYSIPLATPMRASVRMAVRTAQGKTDAPVDYLANRLINVPSFLYHMAVNEDWKGDTITKGSTTDQIRQAVLYGLESASITTSSPIRALRTGEGSVSSVAREMLTNQAGFGVYDESPFAEADRTVRQSLKDGSETYVNADGVTVTYPKTYVDKDGSQKPVDNLNDLKAADPLAAEDFLAKHPELATQLEKQRQDTTQAIHSLQSEQKTEQQARDDEFAAGTMTPEDWRDQSSQRNREYGAAVRERAKDYGSDPKEQDTALSEALTLQSDAIKAATSKTGQIDWEKVDREMAKLTPDQQKLMQSQGLVGETDKRKEYLGDIAQLEPYFEMRDEAWRKAQAENPGFARAASPDLYVYMEAQAMVKDGIPETIARKLAQVEVDMAMKLPAIDSKLYLMDHPELVRLLAKWGFSVSDALRMIAEVAP
ncbi:MAG: hypothetical protein A3E01_15350 [Gammaproteobacteria bacterium RIFCSPHIGHO2_12_FULL_63_22]|nr:MAG: hypothetical protein A3E01_15350 [Gammaproteobacteria bacterium RIFCSPHIGHO2_12_FULL_63_22]